MASQQPPYAQAGPSSNPYYQHPPPMPYAYAPNPYGYYAAPPPDPQHIHSGPASPRVPGRGGGYRGARASYNPYPHPQYLPPRMPSHAQYPHPQAPPFYPQQQQQHPHPNPQAPPFAPQIQIQVPNGAPAPYSPAWQAQTAAHAQSPLSPLPKQLSMLPPVASPRISSPRLFQPLAQPGAPEPQSNTSATSAVSASTSTSDSVSHPPPDPTPAPEHVEPPPPPPDTPVTPFIPPPLSPTTPAAAPRSPQFHGISSLSPSSSSSPSIGGWALWSRRPADPASAPGIIISPRARPPQEIRAGAIADRTPPPSPKTAPAPAADLEPVSSTEPTSTETSATATEAASSPATSVSPPPAKPAPVEEPAPPPVEQPTPAPVEEPAPPPPPRAKPSSWAALLRSPDDPSKPSAKSSVQGFSIPAGAPQHTHADASPAGKDRELAALLTGSAYGNAGARVRPRGLVNTGNMCFANAVLQVLVYCPPFWRLFRELGRYLPREAGPVVGKEAVASATPLVEATAKFLEEFVPAEREKEGRKGKGKEEDAEEWGVDSFIPTGVYEVIRGMKRFGGMTGGHQEDAEEFLGFYLDTLEEELLAILGRVQPGAAATPASAPEVEPEGWLEVGKKNRGVVTRTTKSTESPITRMFGGKFRSTLRTPHQKDSVVVEDWRALQLDISREAVHTIPQALGCLSQPQPVQISMPTRPGHVVDATQHVLVDALPPILVLHLKRFLYDTAERDVRKIGKRVVFESELIVPPEIMAPTRRAGPPAKYKLFGVLYHHGQSASGGHYTLDVLHPNRDLGAQPREAWIRIDDELVSDVTPEDVFGGEERDERCAYLLFYRRVGGGMRA